MGAIAKAIGFAPEEWFDERVGATSGEPRDEGRGIAGKVEQLFHAIRNPSTGGPYTNAEVARMTLGDLSEEEVEGIRTRAIGDPTVSQVAALAGVFGVEPSYLLDRGEPVFDGSSWKRFGMRPSAGFWTCSTLSPSKPSSCQETPTAR